MMTNEEQVKMQDYWRHIRENVDTGEGEIHTMFRLTTSDEDKNGTYTVRRAEIRIAFKEKDEK